MSLLLGVVGLDSVAGRWIPAFAGMTERGAGCECRPGPAQVINLRYQSRRVQAALPEAQGVIPRYRRRRLQTCATGAMQGCAAGVRGFDARAVSGYAAEFGGEFRSIYGAI